MTKNTCGNCRFSRVTPIKPRHPAGYDTIDLQCRFNAPTTTAESVSGEVGYFPAVAQHQWCGKHEEADTILNLLAKIAGRLIGIAAIVAITLVTIYAMTSTLGVLVRNGG